MSEITKLLEKNEIINQIKKLPLPTLKIINFYIKNNLLEVAPQTEEEKKEGKYTFYAIKSCLGQEYNYLVYILNNKERVDLGTTRLTVNKKIGEKRNLCRNCPLDNCIKDTVSDFIFEINEINKKENIKITPRDVIDYIMKDKIGEQKEKLEVVNYNLFSKSSLYSLLFVQAILINEFIDIESINKINNTVKFKYIDLTKTGNYNFFIDKIYDYYNRKNCEEFEININEFEIKDSVASDDFTYFYQLAGYYLYKLKIEKIDTISGINNYIIEQDKKSIINSRSTYYIESYKNKVDVLPCGDATKQKIKSLFNYILNYHYEFISLYVPINIIMYTEDNELVDRITRIIGEFMWYFAYLSDNMRYYNKSMNEILLNKAELKNMYTVENNGKIYNKYGMQTIDNFENIMFEKDMDRNIILNMLTDKIELNNNRVCTVIYGNKDNIKSILSSYPKLSTVLFNIELNIDELNVDEIYKMVLDRIKVAEDISDEVKEKIYSYIKLTYNSSEIKNTDYVRVLYSKIILNQFSVFQNKTIGTKDIPNAYNTKDLPEILSEFNKLVGLEKIKSQINDLISLLKFNNNANIDISKFNLHMVFTGNPGTGKTTVARLLSDILFNLGYIKKNKLVEVSAKDLIAEYIGQTSGKTYNVMKSAFGGVLFIDEAYSIVNTDDKGTFASDCISTILRVMEDQKDNLVVIFAGYEDEMEKFIKFNPGLKSRIGYKIKFEDYSLDELLQIFNNLLKNNDFKIEDKAEDKIKSIIEKSSKIENFGNARYINKIYQDILISHAKNVENEKDKEKLMLITENDIEEEKLLASKDNKRKIGF